MHSLKADEGVVQHLAIVDFVELRVCKALFVKR